MKALKTLKEQHPITKIKTKSQVRTEFIASNGPKQGCYLSPTLLKVQGDKNREIEWWYTGDTSNLYYTYCIQYPSFADNQDNCPRL